MVRNYLPLRLLSFYQQLLAPPRRSGRGGGGWWWRARWAAVARGGSTQRPRQQGEKESETKNKQTTTSRFRNKHTPPWGFPQPPVTSARKLLLAVARSSDAGRASGGTSIVQPELLGSS